MASWNEPALINKRSDDVPAIKNLLIALLKMSDAGTEDVPVNAKRLQEVTGGVQFQKYTGSTWANIGKLMHDVDMLDGKHASSSATANTIPVRDANGKLAGDILGNANTATTAASVAAGYVVPVANGGTGASDEAGARTNLGTNNAANITEGVLAIARGGTGSGTKNFVDLSTAQTIGGNKTFSGEVTLNKNVLKMTVLDTTEGATATRTDTLIQGISPNADGGITALFGAAGNAILGAGEGKNSLLAELAGNTGEDAYIIADGAIHFHPNANTYANKKSILLNAAGELSGLAKVTATSFVGALTGNVTGNCSGSSGSCTGTAASAKTLTIPAASLKKGTKPSSTYWNTSWIRFDSAGTANANRLCELRSFVDTNGKSGYEMLAYDFKSGSAAAAILGIYKEMDGAAYGTAPTPAVADDSSKIATTAWCRDATGNFACNAATATKAAQLTTARKINGVAFNGTADITVADGTKVAKAGDTMTGALKISKNNDSIAGGLNLVGTVQNYGIQISATNLTKGTKPSANINSEISFYGKTMSKWQNRVGQLQSRVSTDNICSMAITAFDTRAAENTGACTISANVDASGNAYTYAPTPVAGSNTTHIATTAWVRARLSNSEFGMVPSNNPGDNDASPGNNGTTYTAPTNGFLKVEHNNGGNYDCWVYINGHGTCMHSGGYGSGGQHSGGACFFPVRKGWKFKVTGSNWFAFQRC